MAEQRCNEKMRKVTVVTDALGQIIATAGVMEDSVSECLESGVQWSAGIRALPGQSLHVVELPDEYFQCNTAIEKHQFLSRYKVMCDPEPSLIRINLNY